MRTRIAHEGVKHLEYEIRHIVGDAHRIRDLGIDITWENIGDPVAMGEVVEPWIVEIVHGLVGQNSSWGYCPSRGVNESREFLAAEVNKRGGTKITEDDILFVNGIADAVDKIYDLIHKDTRVIMPSPCYPTHSSNEAKRGEYQNLMFQLDPKNGWEPDLDELRMMVKYNPQVAAIAMVHPDNPTGLVYSEETLTEIVEIARQYGLFLICDEIYSHICYNGAKTCHLSTVIGDVPAISLRGISKEYPWPGARCGWFEILNKDADPEFATYAKALVDSKMMEVCSTTLPQMSLPLIFGDERYPAHLQKRAKMFEMRANEAYDAFKDIDGVIANKVCGALYFTVVFEDGVLNNKQTLKIDHPERKSLIESLVGDFANDKRLVYYIMGATGICVTPLSGFHSKLDGFRITLLQSDDAKRRETLKTLAQAVRDYIASA